MEFHLVNVAHKKPVRPGAVRFAVHRPGVLGNPYVIPRDGTREEVIAKYRHWLFERIRAQDQCVLAELRAIAEQASRSEVELACFCSPRACHATVIANAVVWLTTTSVSGESGNPLDTVRQNRPDAIG